MHSITAASSGASTAQTVSQTDGTPCEAQEFVGQLRQRRRNLGMTAADLDAGVDYFQAQGAQEREARLG